MFSFVVSIGSVFGFVHLCQCFVVSHLLLDSGVHLFTCQRSELWGIGGTFSRFQKTLMLLFMYSFFHVVSESYVNLEFSFSQNLIRSWVLI